MVDEPEHGERHGHEAHGQIRDGLVSVIKPFAVVDITKVSWRHDSEHNDTEHNGTEHNDTEHSDTQHNNCTQRH